MNAPPDFAGYRVLARLGHGGMANVYLASSEKQPGFTKLFVLKALKDEYKTDPELLAMFVQEAHIAARLNHANVVQTYEVGSANDLPFIAMEFLEGQPLNAVVRRLGSAFPLDMYMRVLSDVLSGLQYAHELRDFDDTPMGIVHRDVSPHNVFVTYDGVVKLLDFGIAKVASAPSVTRAGVVKGKASYMAREQILNVDVDRRADIFAVGVMMFEALTGQRMVAPGTPDVAVLQRRLVGEDPNVRQVATNAPPELVTIAEKALRPEKAERFPTAEEMQFAIEDYLRGSSNPQPRDLGRIVRDEFHAERATLKKTIEQQLSMATPTLATIALAPASGSLSPVRTPAPAPDVSIPVDTEVSSATTMGQSRSMPARSRSPKRALVAVVGLSILACGALLLSLRHREEPAAPTVLGATPSTAPVVPSTPSATPSAAPVVHLIFDVKPKEASIAIDGSPISFAQPLAHPFDSAKHELSVSSPGYRTLNESIAFDHDQTVTVDLPPVGTANRPTTPRSSSRPVTHPQATASSTTTATPPASTGFSEVHPRDPRPIDTTAPF